MRIIIIWRRWIFKMNFPVNDGNEFQAKRNVGNVIRTYYLANNSIILSNRLAVNDVIKLKISTDQNKETTPKTYLFVTIPDQCLKSYQKSCTPYLALHVVCWTTAFDDENVFLTTLKRHENTSSFEPQHNRKFAEIYRPNFNGVRFGLVGSGTYGNFSLSHAI